MSGKIYLDDDYRVGKESDHILTSEDNIGFHPETSTGLDRGKELIYLNFYQLIPCRVSYHIELASSIQWQCYHLEPNFHCLPPRPWRLTSSGFYGSTIPDTGSSGHKVL
ncbi:hypothetical protein PENVUL_c074G03305 [Penicillium vulpinum]|uniref:Uncharacterized protein n=1 Tax=Penicillium vulpinum TaxID=29845 RepID=A0A1V6RAK8_9EURO|nr:hypothetical protein PENVUL_c074G03305 [Penicillium vulpinum]